MGLIYLVVKTNLERSFIDLERNIFTTLEEAVAATFAPEQQVPPAGAAPSPVEQPSPAPAAAPVGGSPMATPLAAAPRYCKRSRRARSNV